MVLFGLKVFYPKANLKSNLDNKKGVLKKVTYVYHGVFEYGE